ncbi:MAG: zinc-binding dehydrogenase [Deltaproteobacteria bacterium]|nr:zinc-binding dehydrogenase [Deltaproteobacteria bacterium]
MKAAILVEQNRPLELAEVEMPARLGEGQVRVRVRYSGICGSQLGEIDGVKGPDRFLPHLLGHEGAGVVLEIGSGVRTVKPGDRVVLHWMKGDGKEADPPAYRWRGRALNAGWVTTFNELAVVSENRVTPIPDHLPLDLAALFGCAVTTGFGVVTNDAGLRIGESIAVFGAGGVGLNVIQAAAMTSAHPIIGVDLHDAKLELAARLGATATVNSSLRDAREAILELTGGEGVDVAVDNTGQPRVIELAYELTKPRGRTVLVGVPRKGNPVSIYSLPLHFGKVLKGSHGGDADPAADIPRYVRLFEAGKLRLGDLVTERFPLERINEAIGRMRSGAVAGRCLIDMGEP